ncbi:zinc dependent phospholipase C family protein [Hathewaya histolytica]|uniref:Phospholipase C n=1 Tax=Hathewaya histolytica TaxID=1498 RepID=A0A4V6KDT7_HATHI|nr:zinc dependent phospholipase C family protein [Hathewaya histolytica]VTQ91907.1 phospholipase C [Hathewaya histolytica]
MKKFLSSILIGTLLFSTLGTSALAKENIQKNEIKSKVYKIANGSNEIFGEGILLHGDEEEKKNTKNPNSNIYRFQSGGIDHTHQYLVARALGILENDMSPKIADKLYVYGDTLLEFADKPDIDEKSPFYAPYSSHFYNPHTGKNYIGQKQNTALIKFKEHAMNAKKFYNINKPYAIEELGRACHYLEDLNVPHHAANLVAVLSNHSDYERFVDMYRKDFAISSAEDTYDKYNDMDFENYCEALLKDCAFNAYNFKDKATSKKASDLREASENVVPYAQKHLAAFLYRFLVEVKEI